MSELIVVLGAGGHARSVGDILLAEDKGRHLVFIDKHEDGETIYGFPVQDSMPLDASGYFCAIGDNERREELFGGLDPVKAINVISPRAYLGQQASIGKGVFVGHDAHIGPLVQIEDNVIINTRAVVDHEVTIGKSTQIGPNVSIGGRVTIGERAFIGIGATVIDHINICSDAIVGAGATVIRDIKEPGTYVGVPARRVPSD